MFGSLHTLTTVSFRCNGRAYLKWGGRHALHKSKSPYVQPVAGLAKLVFGLSFVPLLKTLCKEINS